MLLEDFLKETSIDGNHLEKLYEVCNKIFEQEIEKVKENKNLYEFWKYLQGYPTMLLSLSIPSIDNDKMCFLCLEVEGTEDFLFTIYENNNLRARRIRLLNTFKDNNPKRIMSKFLSNYKLYIPNEINKRGEQ